MKVFLFIFISIASINTAFSQESEQETPYKWYEYVVKTVDDWVYYGESWAVNYNSLLNVDDHIVEIWVKQDVFDKDLAYSVLLYEVDMVRNRTNLLQVTSYNSNKAAVDFYDFSNLPPSWIRHSPNTVGEGTIRAAKAIMRIEEIYLVAKRKIKNFRPKKSEFMQLMITDAEYQILVAATLGYIDDENGDDFFDSIGENLWYIEDIIEHEYKEK